MNESARRALGALVGTALGTAAYWYLLQREEALDAMSWSRE